MLTPTDHYTLKKIKRQHNNASKIFDNTTIAETKDGQLEQQLPSYWCG